MVALQIEPSTSANKAMSAEGPAVRDIGRHQNKDSAKQACGHWLLYLLLRSVGSLPYGYETFPDVASNAGVLHT